MTNAPAIFDAHASDYEALLREAGFGDTDSVCFEDRGFAVLVAGRSG